MSDQPPWRPPEPNSGTSVPPWPLPPPGTPTFEAVPSSPYGPFAPPPPPPPPWQPGPEAPTKKSRRWLIGIVCAILIIGAAVAVAVTVLQSKSKTSQAEVCNRASTGASLASQALPNASATVTPGGTPVAGVPGLPSGQSAGCTLIVTTSGVTVRGYMAVYANSSATNGYRALLVRDGFTQEDGSPASATGTGPLISPDGNTLVLIFATQGKAVVEELAGPPGG